ncbi:MAG: HEAT repeat domain-containing protein [Bacteroidota bacterium]
MNWLTGGKKGEAKRLINQLSDVTQRDKAAQELIRLGDDAVEPLIEALQTKDTSLLPYYQQILARIPGATPLLVKLLKSAHPVIRGRVAEVFILSRDRSAVPALLDAVQGEYFTVRSRSALALGKIGDPKAVQPLLALLKDPEDEVRIAACLALGQFRNPSTFDDIATVLLDDPKIEVRQAAARALGNTQNPGALPYLMEALCDSFWWYEREAGTGDLLLAIEMMGKVAVEPLIRALQDREGTVRKFAAILLGKLGDPRAIEPLSMSLYDMHHEVRKASAESLAMFGGRSIEVLSEALRHPEMWIRIHAMMGLSRIQDPRVAPLLVQMLKDPEREVQKQAVRSLGELKDPRTLPVLQQIMAARGDRELHALAKEALDKITPPGS